jgi:putative peptide zinc metalloprotease protein
MRQSFGDEQASLQVQQVREILSTVNQQLEEKKEELARLKIVAPVAGVIIPAPPRPSRPEEGRLQMWYGSPLAPKNIGATFAESDLICRVGDPNDLEALLVVDQADIELVDEAMREAREAMRDGKQPKDVLPNVVLQLDAYPGETLTSRIVEVAKVELEVTPEGLSSQVGGELDTKIDTTTGVQRPMSTSYQARAPLDDQGKLEGLLCTGLRGRAKVSTKWQSLGQRLSRYISRTFHFEL